MTTETGDEWFDEQDPDVWLPEEPSRMELVIGVVYILCPIPVLLWAHLNSHAMFFSIQIMAGLALLPVMGIDTFRVWYRTQTEFYEKQSNYTTESD